MHGIVRYVVLSAVAAGSFYIEVVGAEYSNSMSLWGDAFHMLGDGLMFGTGIAAILHRETHKGRALEWMLRMGNVIFLFATSFGVAIAAIWYLNHPFAVLGWSAAPFAVFSFVSNFVQWYLAPHEHDHEEAHTAHSQWAHLRGDLYTSAAALASAILVGLTGVPQIDFALSLIACYLNFRLGTSILKGHHH